MVQPRYGLRPLHTPETLARALAAVLSPAEDGYNALVRLAASCPSGYAVLWGDAAVECAGPRGTIARYPYEHADPAAAWEAACTRLGLDSWVDDPRRRWSWSTARDDAHCWYYAGRTHPRPKSHRDMVAALAASGALLTAEALAREVIAALNPWHFPQRPIPDRVVWLARGSMCLSRYLDDAVHDALFAAHTRMHGRGWEFKMTNYYCQRTPNHPACDDVWHVELWKTAVARGLKVPPQGHCNGYVQPPLVGKRWRDLKSPYTPAAALWEMGVAPVAVSDVGFDMGKVVEGGAVLAYKPAVR